MINICKIEFLASKQNEQEKIVWNLVGVRKKTEKPIKPRKPGKKNRNNRTEKKTD